MREDNKSSLLGLTFWQIKLKKNIIRGLFSTIPAEIILLYSSLPQIWPPAMRSSLETIPPKAKRPALGCRPPDTRARGSLVWRKYKNLPP